LYKSIYLFELGISPLQKQKYIREFEILIQESILNAIRDSIPVESILRAYMDESIEEHVTEEIKEEIIMDKETETNKDVKEIIENNVNTGAIGANIPTDTNTNTNTNSAAVSNSKLSFSEELEKINGILDENDHSNSTNHSFMGMDEFDDNNTNDTNYTNDANSNASPLSKLKILDESLELSNLDIHNIDPPSIELDLPDLMNDLDFEVLE
jgi:hypothetical protein